MDRIRERVSRAPSLRIPTNRELPQPTFRIEIREHPYFTEVPFVWSFAGGGYPLTAPGIERMGGSGLPKSFGGGTDILPLFTSLKRSIDRRAAKAEVEKAIAEFCATHSCANPR